MAKINVGYLTIKGRNLYEDAGGRLYIRDGKKNRFYVVPKEDNAKFTFYQNRIALPIAALVLMGFFVDWFLGVIISAVMYIVFEIFYRLLFLNKLTIIENIDLSKIKYSDNNIRNKGIKTNITRIVVALILMVAVSANLIMTVPDWYNISTYQQNLDQAIVLIGTLVCIIFTIIVVISSIKAILMQDKVRK